MRMVCVCVCQYYSSDIPGSSKIIENSGTISPCALGNAVLPKTDDSQFFALMLLSQLLDDHRMSHSRFYCGRNFFSCAASLATVHQGPRTKRPTNVITIALLEEEVLLGEKKLDIGGFTFGHNSVVGKATCRCLWLKMPFSSYNNNYREFPFI